MRNRRRRNNCPFARSARRWRRVARIESWIDGRVEVRDVVVVGLRRDERVEVGHRQVAAVVRMKRGRQWMRAVAQAGSAEQAVNWNERGREGRVVKVVTAATRPVWKERGVGFRGRDAFRNEAEQVKYEIVVARE